MIYVSRNSKLITKQTNLFIVWKTQTKEKKSFKFFFKELEIEDSKEQEQKQISEKHKKQRKIIEKFFLEI